MNTLPLENKWIEHLLVNNKRNSLLTTHMNGYFKGMEYVRNFNPASVFAPPQQQWRNHWLLNDEWPRLNPEEDDPKPYNSAFLFLNSWAGFFSDCS